MKKRGNSLEIFQKENNKGQVWVETVIYLLIAFVMIGLVLSFVKPKVEEMRDKTILDQSLGILKDIDSSIITIGSAGNKRLLSVGLKKGSLIIDSENDIIKFEMESSYEYGEEGKLIDIGNIKVITEETGKDYVVTMTRDFSDGYDITYDTQQILKTLTKAANAYSLYITNRGDSSNKVLIDFTTE